MNGGRKDGQKTHNGRKQREEPEKIRDSANARNDTTQDRLPELVAERKEMGWQFPEFSKKDDKNKFLLHSNRQQLEASVRTAENKVRGLSLCSSHQSPSNNQESIVTTEVTQKLLENRVQEKRRKALEHHMNRGQHEVQTGMFTGFEQNVETGEQDSKGLSEQGKISRSHAEALQSQVKLRGCKHRIRDSARTQRPKACGLETKAVGSDEDLHEHLPVPPKGNTTRPSQQKNVKTIHWSERTKLAIACYQLEEEIKVKIRECDEKEAQLWRELERLQSALVSDETELEREREDKVKAISDREQELKEELARLRRMKRFYQTKQQPQHQQTRSRPCALQAQKQQEQIQNPGRYAKEDSRTGRNEDLSHVPSPPQEAAAPGTRRSRIRRTRTNGSSRRASQAERYTVVNAPCAPYSSQLLVVPCPHSSVVIVKTENLKTETS